MWIKKIMALTLITLISVTTYFSESLSGKNPNLDDKGRWFLAKLDGKSSRAGGIFSKIKPSIRFHSNGEVSGFGGCNGFSGVYAINKEDNTISLKDLVMSTRACGQDINKQEGVFMGMLSGNMGYQITGNQLTLNTKKGRKLSFDFRPDKKYNNKLTGKKWVLTSVGIFEGMLGSTQYKMTLYFKNGPFVAYTSCNTISGRYTRSGNTLKFTNIKKTKKNCSKYMKDEQLVIDILSKSETFELVGGHTLTVTARDKKSLMFNVR